MGADVVVFTSSEVNDGEPLVRALRKRDQVPEPVVMSDFDSLRERLRQSPRCVDVLVLLVSDHEELRELVDMSLLFKEIPRLLVIPDSEPATVALAHRLRPRLLSYVGESFETVARVVDRLLAKRRS